MILHFLGHERIVHFFQCHVAMDQWSRVVNETILRLLLWFVLQIRRVRSVLHDLKVEICQLHIGFQQYLHK